MRDRERERERRKGKSVTWESEGQKGFSVFGSDDRLVLGNFGINTDTRK